MIAAALLAEPELILADEPTTALDVTTQSEVMAILDELRRERGLALLFITHDLDLAAAVCDRTAVMYAGQIVERQASASLHREPAAPVHRGARRRAPAAHRAAGAAAPRSRGGRSAPGRRAAGARSPRAASTGGRSATPPLRSCATAVRVRSDASAPRSSTGGSPGRPMAEPVLAVEGLRKEFGGVVAVDEVSFQLPSGGSLGLVGESGSGKTTIAKMVVGLEAPTAGQIECCGRDRTAAARSTRRAAPSCP